MAADEVAQHRRYGSLHDDGSTVWLFALHFFKLNDKYFGGIISNVSCEVVSGAAHTLRQASLVLETGATGWVCSTLKRRAGTLALEYRDLSG